MREVVTTRTLTADDWALWRALRLAALADSPRAFGSRLSDWQGDADREERWRARLSVPGAHDVVALLDGAPVGMGSGMPAVGAAELVSMWVAPPARGHGVGDLLVATVVEWARPSFAALRLTVKVDNPAARGLYLRNGFVEAPDVPADDGEVAMVLRLR